MFQIPQNEFHQYTDIQNAEELFLNLIQTIHSPQARDLIERTFIEGEINQIDQEGLRNKIRSENIYEMISGLNQLGRRKHFLNDLDFMRDIIPTILHILNNLQIPFIIYQSIFIISNVKGELLPIIIQNLGLKTYFKLLKCSHYQIINQAIWGLNQIFSNRQFIHQFKLFEIEFLFLLQQQRITDMQLFARTCSSICYNIENTDSKKKIDIIYRTINFLSQVIYRIPEEELIIDLCTSLTYLSDLKFTAQYFMEINVIKQMIQMINDPRSKVGFCALVFLNKIFASQNEKLFEHIMNLGYFECIQKIGEQHIINPILNFQILLSISKISKFDHTELIKHHNFIFEYLFKILKTAHHYRTIALQTLANLIRFQLNNKIIIMNLINTIEDIINQNTENDIILIILQTILNQNGIQQKPIDNDLEDEEFVEFLKYLIIQIRQIYQ